MPTDRIVVGDSVLVNWYVPKIGSAEAAAVLGTHRPKLAPEFLVAEFGNGPTKRVRRGELAQSEAMEIVGALALTCPLTLLSIGSLISPAQTSSSTRIAQCTMHPTCAWPLPKTALWSPSMPDWPERWGAQSWRHSSVPSGDFTDNKKPLHQAHDSEEANPVT